MIKWIKIFLVVLTILPLLVAMIIHFYFLVSYLDQVKTAAKDGASRYAEVESQFHPMLIAAETKEGIRRYAMQSAYLIFAHRQKSKKVWKHLGVITWQLSSYIYLNDQEVYGLWLSCIHSMDCSQGIDRMSRRYLGHDFLALSEADKLWLAVMVKSPTMYAPGTERGEKRRQWLLQRLK